MSRWLIMLVLAVAPATVLAQPARPVATAQDTLRTAERKVVQLTAQHNTLASQYAAQLEAIDRLKKQRKSWRQEREVRTALTGANDTASKLAAQKSELARANVALATARKQLVSLVDAELATGPMPARVAELARLKSQLAPQTTRRVSRIVLPDMQIDPLADPEELEDHIKQLLDSEEQLRKQMVGLDKQAKELDEVAKLRKQHDRAGELSRRDDDQPQRTATQGGGGGRATALGNDSDGAPAPEAGGGGTGFGTSVGSFESEVTIVLADVIDATTIETLTRAQRTGDPAQRAQAAKKARDAVSARLEQLKKKRAELEAITKRRR